MEAVGGPMESFHNQLKHSMGSKGYQHIHLDVGFTAAYGQQPVNGSCSMGSNGIIPQSTQTFSW